jgi:hypothetical protein
MKLIQLIQNTFVCSSILMVMPIEGANANDHAPDDGKPHSSTIPRRQEQDTKNTSPPGGKNNLHKREHRGLASLSSIYGAGMEETKPGDQQKRQEQLIELRRLGSLGRNAADEGGIGTLRRVGQLRRKREEIQSV